MKQEYNYIPLREPIPITEQVWPEGTLPLVSTLTTAYNHEPYIRECIEGFLMQKTTFPVELIIHDDASTDKTADIIREYEAKYPNLIKPIYQIENQYSQKIDIYNEFLFPRAKKKYIALCEGDDYWIDPFKLQKQVDFMETNPESGLCFTNIDKYLQNCKSLEKSYFDENIANEVSSLSKYIIRAPWIATCTWVFRTNFVKLYMEWYNNNYYNNFLIQGDLSLVSFILSKSKIFFLNQTTSVYRKHDLGTSNFNFNITNFMNFNRSSLLLRMCICDTLISDDNIKFKVKQNHYVNSIKMLIAFGKRDEIEDSMLYLDKLDVFSLHIPMIIIYRYLFVFKYAFRIYYKLKKWN